ncbi:MAG: choice-of-anchor Q domain-containing protein [Planctomycetota bacterium]
MKRILLTATSVLGLTASLHAETLHVPAQYSSIQAAINASADGDEVVVAPGVYNESVNLMGKGIVVRGAEGAEATTIDATGWNNACMRITSGEGADTVIEGFTFTGGTGDTSIWGTTTGGGISMSSSSPSIRDCVFRGNTAKKGGGMNMIGGAPRIERCIFIDNFASGFGNFQAGGGAIGLYNSWAQIISCEFYANRAYVEGGAIVIQLGAPTIANGVFVGNRGVTGGAILNGISDTTLVNCTFVGNIASQGAGIRNWSNGSPMDVTVENCIMWDHSLPIQDVTGASSTLRHCLVEGGWSGAGDGNTSGHPKFGRMPSAGADGDWGTADDDYGDLCLQGLSPAINSGDTDVVPSTVTTDLVGNSRVIGSIVDMGAHEFTEEVIIEDDCRADIEPAGGNDVVNVDDLLFMINSFGTVSPDSPADIVPPGGDGQVNIDDLLLVITDFGSCE